MKTLNTIVGQFIVTKSRFRKNGRFVQEKDRGCKLDGIVKYSYKGNRSKTAMCHFVKDGFLLIQTLSDYTPLYKARKLKW